MHCTGLPQSFFQVPLLLHRVHCLEKESCIVDQNIYLNPKFEYPVSEFFGLFFYAKVERL